MRLFFHLCLVLGVTCAGRGETRPPDPVQIDVVFLAGQSNGDGRAPAAALPAGLREERADVLLYSHLHGEPKNPDGTRGRLGPLRPGRTQFPANAFGPEIGLGHALADDLAARSPDHRLAIIKYAKGGSSLYGDWRAAGTRGGKDGPHYVLFKQVAHDGLNALRTRFPQARVRLRALVWVQGESDTSAGIETAKAYAENLQTWIEDFRAAVDSPGLPVVITRLSANQLKIAAPDRPEREAFLAVRECQDRVPSLMRGVETVRTDGPEFSFLSDRLHFDAQGQLALGGAVARVIIGWESAALSLAGPPPADQPTRERKQTGP